jgi:8-amino-7-oxononanoate synthase
VSEDVFDRTRRHDRLEFVSLARQHDVLPYFRRLESIVGPTAEIEGSERVMLGGNNYLGLTTDRRVLGAARDALDRYGTGVTGSRTLHGTLRIHDELEQELAEWLGAEEVLVFSTGYGANLGCIATLMRPGDNVICDAADHASIFDAVAMSQARMRPFRHNDIKRLDLALEMAQREEGGMLVVVDGVFSMEGDVADLAGITQVCRDRGARLLVDEAHGIGVLGPRGAGAGDAYGVEGQIDLRMGTFSKSLASCGGFIAGPAAVIDFLRLQSRPFMFTASGVPASLGAALGALRVIRSAEGLQLLGRLRDNAMYLRAGLSDQGWNVSEPSALPDGTALITPIIPVLVGKDWEAVRLWKALFDLGVYVNVALYPAVPRGQALLRTSVTAAHTREHLGRALAEFAAVRSTVETLSLKAPT